MNCAFPDNSTRVEPEPITVHCLICGRTVTTDVFPIYASCRGNPIGSFLVKICPACPGIQPGPESPADPPRLQVGTWLALAIAKVTFGRIRPCPDCKARMAAMNRWGDRLYKLWKSNARKFAEFVSRFR